MRIVEAWASGREPQFNVVGESRYYDQIRKIAARLGGGRSGQAITVAVLKPEPDNAYGRNAVQVTIDDLVVGYLPAEEAPGYSPLLNHLARLGVLVSVPARVWWDADDGYMASIRLDLAPPGLLVPLNASPAGNVMQLPPGNALQVTGEDAHLDVLAPFVSTVGQAAALVTLHEVTDEKSRGTRQVVEVRMDGRRVGQLTPATSDHLLAVVRHAASVGVTLCCRASVRGNQLKAEVVVYPTKAADLPPAWIIELEQRGSNARSVQDVVARSQRGGESGQLEQVLPTANWYANPTGPGLRWWDGTQWTEHTHVQ